MNYKNLTLEELKIEMKSLYFERGLLLNLCNEPDIKQNIFLIDIEIAMVEKEIKGRNG
jgi:hypothetical protein